MNQINTPECVQKKEFVSIKIDSVKQHKQKSKLPLCNLKELHIEFLKGTHIQIGFSKFCQLRPKWFITVNSGSGIHFVCVCEICQNVKLLPKVLPCDYKELLTLMVRNTENRDCMLHSCDDCPGENNICEFLTSVSEESDDDEVVSFKHGLKMKNSQILSPFNYQ